MKTKHYLDIKNFMFSPLQIFIGCAGGGDSKLELDVPLEAVGEAAASADLLQVDGGWLLVGWHVVGCTSMC